MSDAILLDITAPIATITLNRPEVRNAFNFAMWQDLAKAIGELGERRDVRAIVVKGAGGKAFAAGADVSEFETLRNTIVQSQRYGDTLEHAL
jgi:enoyl-CoA hydratase